MKCVFQADELMEMDLVGKKKKTRVFKEKNRACVRELRPRMFEGKFKVADLLWLFTRMLRV